MRKILDLPKKSFTSPLLGEPLSYSIAARVKMIFLALSLWTLWLTPVMAGEYGIAMHGKPKYSKDQHFDYVNPNAPVGGQLTLGAIGTFDSYNPYVTKGIAPAGLDLMTERLVFESLMMRSADEPFSLYGLIAESVDMPENRSWIQFNLRPEAKWSDGQPITAEDVLYSYKILREKGRPNLRLFYSKVKEAKIIDPLTIKFTFDKLPNEDCYDPELPLLIGLMSVLPKHLWENKDIESLKREDIVGSGPYRIKESEPGHTIVYERRKDYWGWEIPHRKGHYNFQTVRYDYYRNRTAALEAFKAGYYDIKTESQPSNWIHDYDFKAVKSGDVIKREIEHNLPVGLSAFVFNTRRPIFKDPKVRQALTYAFDFEWLNRTLFYNSFTRTRSYFDNTELASKGPISQKEIEILGPYYNKLSYEAIHEEYHPANCKGGIRENLERAQEILESTGWEIKNNQLVNKQTKQPFTFEILLYHPNQEKISLSLARNLQHLGIRANVRVIDPSQFERRRMNFNYDMIINTWGHTLSPGREQTYYWGAKAADEPGSRNYAGIQDDVVDYACSVLATAQDRDTLVSAARILDRALLWGHYVIPLYHNKKIYLAYWDKFGHPEFRPDRTIPFTTWWSRDAEQRGNSK